MKLGVALSGGGHRASAWGAGVLAALVDARLGSEVVSVSSVSGGSITNGIVAQNVDLRTADSAAFDAAVGPALHNYAVDGLFPNGLLTGGYLRWVKVFAVLSGVLVIAFVLGLPVATFVEGWLGVGIVAAIAVAMVVAIVVLLSLVSRRGVVVRSALARTHYRGDRSSLGTTLASLDRRVNHVILATDLEAGDQFYLAPRFLYGFREGVADPCAGSV